MTGVDLSNLWTSRFNALLAEELKRSGAGNPTTPKGQAILRAGSTVFESLLTLLRDLENDKSDLVARLGRAEVEKDWFRAQMSAFESSRKAATRRGKPGVLALGFVGLSAVLRVLVPAIAEGASSGLASQAISTQSRSASLDQRASVAEYISICEALHSSVSREFGEIAPAPTFINVEDDEEVPPVARYQFSSTSDLHDFLEQTIDSRPWLAVIDEDESHSKNIARIENYDEANRYDRLNIGEIARRLSGLRIEEAE